MPHAIAGEFGSIQRCAGSNLLGVASLSIPIMWRLFREFLVFLKQEKKWWLIPLVLLLLLLAAIILFGSSAVLAPFMYPFM